MGTTLALAAAASSTAKTSSSSSLLLIVVVFGVMILFMFRSQRRRQRQAQDTQKQVMDGARIRTTFGVYGTIVESDDRNVIVEVAPGVRVKMVRQAIMTVVPDDEPDGVRPPAPDFDGSTSTGTFDGASTGTEDNASKPDDDRSDLTI
jgi:preprotein translocase subunit YajC